ncbi:putative FAD-binding dehydrogenase [Rubripirellula amarantea]|uniref:Putative FAD-binding dehydrogenase n=1 Tax=Rubripirellula amarantea TaxID=2527999 RepID=A0A5C5WAK2_9BACT|nr:FAD-dependent oxidoreductase [Rubripirellula amarantea]TWT47936.1 putative FAD-binding dehydrogenase [Rubripirellula amarantea]
MKISPRYVTSNLSCIRAPVIRNVRLLEQRVLSENQDTMRQLLAITMLFLFVSVGAAKEPQCGVLVYGGTPAGIAAALAAADDGESVVLVERTRRVGGLVTSGLSHTDFHAREGLTGAFLDFADRVETYYVAEYGRDSQQVKDCFGGVFAEPHVNLAVLNAMLKERVRVRVITEARLEGVELDRGAVAPAIRKATFIGADGKTWDFSADVFIDASYEGDLMAKAGVPYCVGREGRAAHDEPLAPQKADMQLQAYNFRFTMTKKPKHRVAPSAPEGYRREDFVAVLDVLNGGEIESIFGYPKNCLFKAQTPPLPNDKYDINDVSGGAIRLSLPGQNLGWPEGTAEERDRIFAEHLRDQVGLLYFLQNDDAVPKRFRDEASEWGWCRDEFEDTGHLPPQLYVREARRMVGQYLFTQHDCQSEGDEARARLHPESVAIGEYGNNCHGTGHEGTRFSGRHIGEFYNQTPPYQIPYGVIVPPQVTNLLVPVAASSTHVGFCALRLEPIWMSLGQAAGHAAHLVRAEGVPVQKVPVRLLQQRLHSAGAATVYAGDVPRDHPLFRIVQAIGTAGGLHGLANKPDRGPRGATIHGQYTENYPSHAVELKKDLSAELAERWGKIALGLDLDTTKLPKADGNLSRSDWLQEAASLLRRPTR